MCAPEPGPCTDITPPRDAILILTWTRHVYYAQPRPGDVVTASCVYSPAPGDLVVLRGVAGRRVRRRRRARVRLRARCHNNCSRQHPGASASGLERDLASIAGILKVTITLLIDNRESVTSYQARANTSYLLIGLKIHCSPMNIKIEETFSFRRISSIYFYTSDKTMKYS